MNKIYLHMGLHKTATTSFQGTCAKNQELLKQQGYLYPLFHCLDQVNRYNIPNHSIPLFSAFTTHPEQFHMNIEWNIQDIASANKGYLDTLHEALGQEQDLIISGEGISLLEEDELGKLLDVLSENCAELVPIACLRSPYEYHCSWIQQRVKGGLYTDILSLFSQKERILKLNKVFAGKVNFFPFTSMRAHPQGPVGFLMEVIGVDHRGLDIANANEGVSNVFVRVQNQLNSKYPAVVDNNLNPAHKKIRRSQGPKFLLTSRELEQLQESLDAENRFMEHELGPHFCDKSYPMSEEVSFENLLSDHIEVFSPMQISQTTVDHLREQALLCEEAGKLHEAYELMLLAQHGRPDGPFIKDKLKEYKKAIHST